MSRFKDQVFKDLEQVFFNIDEFADWHYIGQQATKIKCIIDTTENTTRSYNKGSSFGDNIFNCDMVVRYQFKDWPHNLTSVHEVYFDKVKYEVVRFSVEAGIVELRLNILVLPNGKTS